MSNQIQNPNVKNNKTNKKGFSLVEVLLASSIFILFVTVFVGAFLYGQESTMFAGNLARATMLAEEGLEATRNIRDANFFNLIDGQHGLAISGNQWGFSGMQDVNDIFTRQIIISPIDPKRKSVTVNVGWQQNPQRAESVALVTRMTDWQASVSIPSSCNDYAIQQGYEVGTCRQNIQQCMIYEEIYLSDGDIYCTGGPFADTCCAI